MGKQTHSKKIKIKNKRLSGPPPRGHQLAACRHADFCPFPANNASPVTELDTRICTDFAPGAPPPDPCRIALHFVRDLFVYRSLYAVPEAGPKHLSPTENARVPNDSCRHADPHSFLSGSGQLHALSPSYIHLPNALSLSSLNDTFHSSAVLGTSFHIAEVICLPGTEERNQRQILLCQISILSSIISVRLQQSDMR